MNKTNDVPAKHQFDLWLSVSNPALPRMAAELLSAFNYVCNKIGVNIFHARKMMCI